MFFLISEDFSLRLPCGDSEKSRKAIRDFLVLRRVNRRIKNLPDDTALIVESPVPIIQNDVLDLRK